MTDTVYDPVSDELACPKCRENDTDKLEILPDDSVKCLTCGKLYRPLD